MEWDKIIIGILVIIAVIFVIKNFKGILVAIVVGFLTLFLAVFVVKDMLHFPIDNYVDVSEYDRIQNEGLAYVEDKLEELSNKEKEENKDIVKDTETVSDIDEDGADNLNYNEEMITEKIAYDGLTEEERVIFIKRNEFSVEDKNFAEKLMGMSEYVNITYDLGNAILRNSEDNKYIVLEFK